MQTNMTERDKKLLVGMFLFVIIVAIGYWGIYPQVKKFNKLNEKIEIEKEDKKLNQQKIMNLGTIEIQADDYEKKIAEKKDEFYQIMNSSEIDRMMTELASESGLDIYDLNFTMPTTPSERMAYQYSDLYQRQLAAKEGSDSSEEDSSSEIEDELSGKKSDDSGKKSDSDDFDMELLTDDVFGPAEGEYQPNTDIYAVPVTMTVGGDLYDLDKFLDKLIALDKRTLLVGYSWGEFRDVIKKDVTPIDAANQNDGSGDTAATDTAATDSTASTGADGATTPASESYEIVVRKSLTVRLEIYMCDTADIATTSDAAE